MSFALRETVVVLRDRSFSSYRRKVRKPARSVHRFGEGHFVYPARADQIRRVTGFPRLMNRADQYANIILCRAALDQEENDPRRCRDSRDCGSNRAAWSVGDTALDNKLLHPERLYIVFRSNSSILGINSD
jgi:hypothetical protein